ncbi:DUF87 domain-containing protein [Candidatus Saccharibacteria bacterium]|nr:DUF87 domain-containing protein [Candidatus Saccharibacteria bacterium]
MISSTKASGLQYWFELYLTQDKFDSKDWDRTLNALSRHIGFLKVYSLVLSVESGVVKYYLSSDCDLSFISNNLEGVVIRPIDEGLINIPVATKREPLVQYVTGGNLLDIREKYQIQRGKELNVAVFNIRPISSSLFLIPTEFYFKGIDGSYSVSKKRLFSLPLSLLTINFKTSTKYLREKQPKYLDIQKTLHIMRGEPTDAVFEVDTFPYLPKNYFLPLQSYDFDKHSFIIGASGSGKSKLISLMIDKLNKIDGYKNNYRIIVIDPHASIESDLTGITDQNVVSFKDQDESVELFSTNSNSDISAAVELTGTLFKSLLSNQFNPKVERVLRFSLFVLMTAQIMSLENMKRLLTDIEFRNKLLDHVENYIPQNISQFFKTDFNELRTQSYTESILPIISLVDEMQLQPALVEEGDQSRPLDMLIKSKFLTVFSLNKISMGEKVVKTVSGLLMQQIFLLAQARAFDQKIILIIDEVSVIQNPAMAAMLAEARKYNLSIFLTQQYFGQIDKDLRDAIFTNVVNYYVFRVSEEDARALEGNLTIELPKEILVAEKDKGSNESQVRVRMLTSLNVRECLIRLGNNGQILPCMKARTMDNNNIETEGFSVNDKTGDESHSMPTKFVDSDPIYKQATIHAQSYAEYGAARNLMADIAMKPDITIGQDTNPPQAPDNPAPPDGLPSISLNDLLKSTSSKRNNTEGKE